MRDVIFSSAAKKDYDDWQRDKKTLRKIVELITDIDLHPYSGIGRPEPLKHELTGYWSRRINSKDRLVYGISAADEIVIISCKGHYSK